MDSLLCWTGSKAAVPLLSRVEGAEEEFIWPCGWDFQRGPWEFKAATPIDGHWELGAYTLRSVPLKI